MKLFKYSMSIIFLVLCSCTTFQNVKLVSLKEKSKEPLPRKAKNILILGIGSTASRIFLDKATGKLIAGLSKKDVSASYIYLGKSNEDATNNYTKLDFKGDDLILLITPNDASNYQVFTSRDMNTNYNSNVGYYNTMSVTSTVMYSQQFKLTLYDVVNDKKQIWSSLLNIECELGQPRINTIVSDLILAKFKKNMYLP